jgi:hypothetical protein
MANSLNRARLENLTVAQLKKFPRVVSVLKPDHTLGLYILNINFTIAIPSSLKKTDEVIPVTGRGGP